VEKMAWHPGVVSLALVPTYCIIRWQEAAAAYGSASLCSISEPVNFPKV
jgi:hypothetical protein